MIVSPRRDAANGLPRDPLTVESVGPGLFERATWDQRFDITTMAADVFGRHTVGVHDPDSRGR